MSLTKVLIKSKNTPNLFYLLTLVFILFLPVTGYGKTSLIEIESKVKKIVMMLNIAAREYTQSVENGQLIDSLEYKESQEFLHQARVKTASLFSSANSQEGTNQFEQSFKTVLNKIQNKQNSKEIKIALKNLQNQILIEFNIDYQMKPTQPISLENGRQLYLSNCKVCHGPEGGGDGPLSLKLNPKPANLRDPKITGADKSNAYENFEVINVGIANTDMIGWADKLTEKDIWDVTYYIRTFSNVNLTIPVASADIANKLISGGELKQTFREIKVLLKQSLSAFKNGKKKEASEFAFEAYMVYEKIESLLASKSKIIGDRLEDSFDKLRGKVQSKTSVDKFELMVNKLNTELDEGLAIMKGETNITGLFIQSFTIIFREGFEAILILAALVAFLIKSQNSDKVKIIYLGAGLAIVASLLTAYIFNQFIQISTANQEVMEGIIMLVAVGFLFYISFWLISKIGAQKFQQYVNIKLHEALSTGSTFTLGMLAFLSVYREGFETVLFYKALHTYSGSSTSGILTGLFAGCVGLGLVFYLINKLGIRIPIRWFFAVTGIFLYYMAFTFMGKGIHSLQVAGSLSLTQIDLIPQLSWIGIYPTLETLFAQGTLLALFVAALIYSLVIQAKIQQKD